MVRGPLLSNLTLRVARVVGALILSVVGGLIANNYTAVKMFAGDTSGHFLHFILSPVPVPFFIIAIWAIAGIVWAFFPNRPKLAPQEGRRARPVVKPPPPAPGRMVVQVVDRNGPVEGATAMLVSEENRAPGPHGNTDASGAVALDRVGEDSTYTLLVAHDAYSSTNRTGVEGRKRRVPIMLDDASNGGSMLLVGSQNYLPGFPESRISPMHSGGRSYVHIGNMSVDGQPANPYYFELNKEFVVANHAGPQFAVTFRYSEGEVSLLDYVPVNAPEKRRGSSAPRKEYPHILLAELGEYLDMRATSDPDAARDGKGPLELLSERKGHAHETMRGYFSEYEPRVRALYADLAEVDKQRDPAMERLIIQRASEPADIRKIQKYLYYLAV